MLENIIGLGFAAALGVFGFVIVAEFFFSLRDWIYRRDPEPEEMGHLTGSQFHLGANPPVGGSGSSLLRRRHYRTAELQPRGRWGFALRWRREG